MDIAPRKREARRLRFFCYKAHDGCPVAGVGTNEDWLRASSVD